jgi:hypothetical protein
MNHLGSRASAPGNVIHKITAARSELASQLTAAFARSMSLQTRASIKTTTKPRMKCHREKRTNPPGARRFALCQTICKAQYLHTSQSLYIGVAWQYQYAPRKAIPVDPPTLSCCNSYGG